MDLRHRLVEFWRVEAMGEEGKGFGEKSGDYSDGFKEK